MIDARPNAQPLHVSGGQAVDACRQVLLVDGASKGHIAGVGSRYADQLIHRISPDGTHSARLSSQLIGLADLAFPVEPAPMPLHHLPNQVADGHFDAILFSLDT